MRPAHLSPGLVLMGPDHRTCRVGVSGRSKEEVEQYRSIVSLLSNPPPPPQHDLPSSVCTPVEKYDNYKVTEFGSVAGAAKMKAEIYARGDLLHAELSYFSLSRFYLILKSQIYYFRLPPFFPFL